MTEEQPESFGQLLRHLRSRARLTQAELAERAGISARGIQDLERGVRRNPHQGTVRRIALGLGLGEISREDLQRAAAAAVAGQQLPAMPSPLIGREGELAAARSALIDRKVRLLTLTGVGGVGKTRLAIEIGDQLRSEYDGRVCFAGLSAVSDPAAVLPTIAHAVGASDGVAADSLEGIQDSLRNDRVLLLVDNAEHLVDCVALHVASVISQCPGLQVLATSREPLRVRWEHELTVAPLAIADTSREFRAEQVASIASIALFTLRARQVLSDFALTDSNGMAVAEICARLDGLPLAIELAAVHVKHLPPRAIAAKLDHRLPFLISGRRDAPPRHNTLRDAINWSYELLSPDEQRLFRILSVVRGGLDIEAATAIWRSIGGLDDPTRLIISLLNKSLLKQSPAAADTLHVTWLETIREFALEQFEAADQTHIVRQVYAEHFLHLAVEASAAWDTADATIWLDRCECEHANLRAAFEWYVRNSEAEPALRLAASLSWFWRTRGYAREGRDLLETALGLDPRATPSATRAEALHQSGELARLLGLYEVAEARLSDALAIFRLLYDRRGILSTLDHLSATARFQGRYAATRDYLDEALPIARELADAPLLRKILVALGALATNESDFGEAVPWLEEALGLALRERDLVGQVQALCYLGIVATNRGDFLRASAQLRQALKVNQQLGDLDYFATLFDAFAGLAAARGQYPDALRLIGAADGILHEVGTQLLPPIRQARRDVWISSAISALGEPAADQLQQDGRCLNMDESVALAFASL